MFPVSCPASTAIFFGNRSGCFFRFSSQVCCADATREEGFQEVDVGGSWPVPCYCFPKRPGAGGVFRSSRRTQRRPAAPSRKGARVSSLGPERSFGKTAVRRHKRRLRVLSTALSSLVATVKLSGPSHASRLSSAGFSNLVSNGFRLARGIIQSRLHFTYTHSDELYIIPAWAVSLYRATSLPQTVPISRAWRNLLGDAKSFLRGTTTSVVASAVTESNYRGLDYNMSELEKSRLLQPLRAERVSLPPEGHTPQPLLRFLRWPWTEIFNESNLPRLLNPYAKVVLPRVPAFNNFASKGEELAVYTSLHLRNMLRFVRYRRHSRPPANGLFGLAKSKVQGDLLTCSLRLLADLRRGNVCLIDMSALQRLYRELVDARGGPEACGLSPKAMDLFTPARLADLPRWRCKVQSDLKDYFHFLLVPEWWQWFQALTPVRAGSVGLPGSALLTPVLTTLAMGGTFSALVAQLVHESVLTTQLASSLSFRPRLLVDDRVSGRVGPDGLVRLGDVPKDILRPLVDSLCFAVPDGFGVAIVEESGLPAALSDFRVPPDSLLVQLSDKGEGGVGWMGWDARRGDVELAMWRANTKQALLVHSLWSLYIDDQQNFVVSNSDLPLRYIDALGNRALLATVILAVRAGFRIQQAKVLFASRVPGPTLGYVVDPVGGAAVDNQKRLDLARALFALADEAETSLRPVRVSRLAHLLGGVVWAMLVRRCLLSAIFRLFERVKGRPQGAKVWLRPGDILEIRVIASLLTHAVGAPRVLCPVVGAFDAATGPRGSNGAYGVVVKPDCPEQVGLELSAAVERHGSWSAFSQDESGNPLPVRQALRLDSESAQAAADWLRFDWSGVCEWKVVHSRRWLSFQRHVTVSEARAGSKLVHWYASQPKISEGARCLGLGDNQPSLGCLSKGRSSVFDLNRVCGSVAALSILADLSMFWLWLRSACNPSDAPSRWPL